MNAKAIVAIIAVIAIIGVAFVAMGAGNDTTYSPDARYNYEIKITDSYADDLGYVDQAGEGKTFVIATVTVANDHYGDGISTNFFILDWVVDMTYGVKYSSSGHTICHPGYQDATIGEGSVLSYVVVFEVPKVTTAGDIAGIEPDYLAWDVPTFERDTSL